MKTNKNPSSQVSHRIASRGRMILGAGLLGLASMACTAGLDIRPKPPTFEAQAEFGGVATAQAVATTSSDGHVSEGSAPAEAGPTASNYAQSGGGTYESAEVTSAGATIAGRVAKGAPRFYAIDLAVGDSLSLKIYGRQLTSETSYMDISIVEPDMVDLISRELSLYHGPDKLERKSFSATASQAGRHLIKIDTSNNPAEYRIEITGLTQAAR